MLAIDSLTKIKLLEKFLLHEEKSFLCLRYYAVTSRKIAS